MAKNTENPTDSDVWTVLEHRDGGLEVWDCEAFGPWKLVTGPFDSYVEAARAYHRMPGTPDRRNVGETTLYWSDEIGRYVSVPENEPTSVNQILAELEAGEDLNSESGP